MLTVAKVTASGAVSYADYLEGKTRASELGDYYLKDGERTEAPGRWAGGAAAVGVDPRQAVAGEQLRALMAVRRPDNGLPLRRVGASGVAVTAIDATFSAPKSVSAAWALAGPELRERIERAHEAAIDRALSYATEQVAMIRERVSTDRVIHARAVEVIATSWRHTTARAVGGRPPDPQLHSHVLLHGAVRGDGRVVAIDSRSWLVHGRELGAAYRTELARELARLGFRIRRGTGRGGRYFELGGIPARLIDRWSSRHHQVREAIDQRLRDRQAELEHVVAGGGPDAVVAIKRIELLRRNAQLTPGEDRLMAASTRADKLGLATASDLDRHWVVTGRAAGFETGALERLRSHSRPPRLATHGELLSRLTEFDATFAAREARAVALEASAGAPISDALREMDRLRARGEIVALADGRETTSAHRHIERQTVSIAQTLAAGRVTPIPPTLVARESRRLDEELVARGGRLSREQREALELACSDAPLVAIEGHAGSGKSTVLAAIARTHQAAGREIVVTSTAALSAQRLARELDAAGVTASWYSTAGLHAAIATGRTELSAETTVIHDEAALASTREQQQLLHAVETAGARLIEVGDPRQSQAVGAGGLWSDLAGAARSNQAHRQLTRNVRATDPADRTAQRLFREGRHELAVRNYAARDRVHIASDQRQAEDRALEAAHADRGAGKRTIVIAQTSNEHLDELNARAQAIRLQHGELGQPGLPIPGRPYSIHPGDHVQVRRTVPLGDGVVRNGTTGQTIDVDSGRARLRLADGREVSLERSQLERADLRLAYVQHPFPAQGETTDTAHLIVSENATQEGTYVALTRARRNTHIHAGRNPDTADQLQTLAERGGRAEPDIPSIHTPLAHEAELEREQHHSLGSAKRDSLHMEASEQAAIDPAPPDERQAYARTERWSSALDEERGHRRMRIQAELNEHEVGDPDRTIGWEL